MIEISDKRKCVGCANCVQVCPVQCIRFIPDEEGFMYPLADSTQCIGCDRCHQVCPVEQSLSLEELDGGTKAYGAYHQNDAIRMQSSSGGVFSALAIQTIRSQGIVYGATMTTDCRVEHIPIQQEEDLSLLQKSKYVQSDVKGIFPQIKKHLDEGKKILFCGTPCQVKALHTFLGVRGERLLTVEVVCHGVPSPMVFRKYMEEEKAESMVFRRKERSWSDYDVEIRYRSGRVRRERAAQNLYMRGFLQNWFLRPSCAACPAKDFSSGADITLGDFWGGEKLAPELFDKKGTSIVFLHTNRACEIWSEINDNLVFAAVPSDKAMEGNECISRSVVFPLRRGDFWKDVRAKGVHFSLRRYAGDSFFSKRYIKKQLLTFWNKVWNLGLRTRNKSLVVRDRLYASLTASPTVEPVEKTLSYIMEHHCSVSRFGDGELKFILGGQTWFQDSHPLLQQRLSEILLNRQEGLMVCVPNVFGDLSVYTEHDRNYWSLHLARTRKSWYQHMDLNKTYFDAFISRCYMPYQDKSHAGRYFGQWKLIWEKRDLLIIEGEKTRLGVGNDLFDNVHSIKRILCPNTQGFTYYDQILQETLKYNQEHLVLIAVGPTATVLAADLASKGYQAIDIGHIDIEYEWYLHQATHKIPVRNKFVNEAGAGRGVGESNDSKYLSEIVCRF